ncbi:MAG: Lon protease family protein [Candidatus Berkiella sp.]
MKEIAPLSCSILRPAVDSDRLSFATTEEITNLVENIGQTRALQALSFGIEMRQIAYHLYAAGPSGLGKKYFIKNYLRKVVSAQPPPDDWCYVNNFKESHKPIALKFPSGEGDIFKQDMQAFIDQLGYAIPAMFESKEYRTSIERIRSKHKSREEKLINKIIRDANDYGLMLIGKPGNYEVVAWVDNEKMTKEQFAKLSEKEQKNIILKINKIQNRLTRMKEEMPAWFQQKHIKLKEIKTEFTNTLVATLIAGLKEKYNDPKVLTYLRDVQKDIVESPEIFLNKVGNKKEDDEVHERLKLIRYAVNVIVGNDKMAHSPIVFESNPTYINLVGQLEGTAEHGTVISDLTLIKPGALHKANGGYLIIEINKVLKESHAWESLKRILLSKKISMEPLQTHANVSSTQLQPEAIPLDVKVILLGYREKYDSLSEEDDDFNKLFKVLVDFETTIERSNEQIEKFAAYLARIIKRRKLSIFHKSAIAEIINRCIRAAGDSQKIALQRSALVEIMEESNYWASKRGEKVVYQADVEKTFEAKIQRIDKIRKEFYEDITTGSILIDLKSEAVGQVNGISIINLSNFSFGLPTRITATTRSGKESMVDIQREVNLGGANHSKGVLILAGYLKGHYAIDQPFFLSASLVLEQTYGLIDGDSASLGELCALISSLANVPLKQSLGVSGSINQHGIVQSVGGINEKVEGFFDMCVIEGLTGSQGVIIPHTNIKNLMLKKEVVEACEKGLFNVYAVNTIDEALALLTDKRPEDIHKMCESTIIKFAKARKGIIE